MKKALPILIALVLIVAVGIGYFMGQRSNEPTIENPPAESSTPETTPEVSTEVLSAKEDDGQLTQSELEGCFEKTYEYVWNNPLNYNADYSKTDMEIEGLEFFIEEAGYAVLPEYGELYLAWRIANHPSNAYHLNFSGNYLITVGSDKLYVYATPHIELPAIGEFYKFDQFDGAQRSDDGLWYKAEYQGTTVYFRRADIGTLTDAEFAEHVAEASFKVVNETVYATDTVNIRQEASASSTKLGQLKKGNSIVRIGIGEGEYTGWSKVRMADGTVAYISSNYLTTNKPSTNTSNPTTSGSGSNGSNGGSTPPPADSGESNSSTNNTAGQGYTDMGNNPDVEVWDFDDTNSENTGSEGHVGEGTGAGLTING